MFRVLEHERITYKFLPNLLAVFNMASRNLLQRANFFSFVAVSQLNSLRLSQLLATSFIKPASYVTCSKNRSNTSDPRAETVKTSLVQNKYGVRSFSLQNWLG